MKIRELALSIYAGIMIGVMMLFFYACNRTDFLNYDGPIFDCAYQTPRKTISNFWNPINKDTDKPFDWRAEEHWLKNYKQVYTDGMNAYSLAMDDLEDTPEYCEVIRCCKRRNK